MKSSPGAVAVIAGSLLVLAAGAIHLWLYFDYFHRVHVVGILFLVNAAAAAAVGGTLLVTPRIWALVGGIGYCLGTLAAFFISVYHGLFGYVEHLTGPWQEAAGLVEVAALIALVFAAVLRHSRTVSRPAAYAPLRQVGPRRQQ